MTNLLSRREWIALAGVGVLAAQPKADYTLEIGPVSVQLGPKTAFRTTGYNGSAPGPLLRMKEGVPFTIDVVNRTAEEEIVHWHGLHIPPEVDGAMEEGTPMIPPGATARYTFTPTPSGTRWYHTHTMAMRNLKRGLYNGQFGILYIEPKNEPGAYDRELFLVLKDWDPYFSTMADAMDVMYKHAAIHAYGVGPGEPVKTKPGQKVMLRILNASATIHKRIAFAGHQFTVVAMDGNPVPAPKAVPILELGPAERIDALVEMTNPGVWVLGSTDERERKAGSAIVVEYAGQSSDPKWVTPAKDGWNYGYFSGLPAGPPAPIEKIIPLVIEKKFAGSHWVDKWTINGKSWPNTDPIQVREGKRYVLSLDNRSDEAHPFHLHRHTFQLRTVGGFATGLNAPMYGIHKDVVVVPAKRVSTVEFVASNPGKTLFHCHQQMHMDYGFMSLMEYDQH
jgi:FtsP/CotA-like multicopper oxidase with cupredoxin domain